MPVKITNMTNRPVMIRLNSGRICYLGGKDASEDIIEPEVLNNHKLNRLQTRNIIRLEEMKKEIKASVKITKSGPRRRKK